MMINEPPQRRSRIWSFARAAVLCALALAPCRLAHAEYRLGVLQLEREDTKDDPLSASFMQALRAALAERKDYTLVDTHVSLTQLSVAQDCNTEEAACLTRIAHGLEIDGFIFGKWSLAGGNPVATVRRYDAQAAAVNASALASFASREPSDAAIRGEVQKLVNALLGPAPRAPAVAAQPAAKPRELPELAEEPAPAPVDGVDAIDEGSGVDPRTVAAYSLAGLAVASAAMAVVSFVQVDSASHDKQFESYRLAVGQSNAQARDVCDEASAGRAYGFSDANFRQVKSACSRGNTFEVLQFVFIGGAVVSAGVSALLFATSGSDSDKATASRLRLQPMAAIGGRGATGLKAQLSF
jgi:hypothetical protein